MNSNDHANGGAPHRRSRIAFWVIAAIAAYFLLVEHREHLFGFLPFLLLLLCPLMHIFHHGHGGHGDQGSAQSDGGKDKAVDQDRSSHHHHH